MSGYAQGGYVAPPDGGMGVPIMLSRGHTLMSLSSYRALSPKMREKLFPNSDIELVFTADEVRELGEKGLAKLQEELDGLQ